VHGEEIALYSAHLHPSSAELREREVTGMLAVMSDDLVANRSVILQGDLNHRPTGPEYPRWFDAGLVDAFAAKGRGQPLTIRSDEPRSRIDYVWASTPLAERLRECRVLYEGAFRTNPDDPRSFALSDHIPVMASFAAGAP
jgi:endonuclease/exonuclease/phosphatase family metal-dependent hydrolase